MIEKINGETFEEYLEVFKKDFYHQLSLAGYEKSDMTPSFMNINEMMLRINAERFWEIKLFIDREIKDSFIDTAIPGENHPSS